jgi:predicted MPP superfamily phosphohydrolase
VNRAHPLKSLLRAMLRPPYRDEVGRKGWFERISRAQPHLARRFDLAIAGWPRAARPLRIAFLSDLHAGSHAGDVARLAAIVAEAQAFKPDLALHGGDFVNMQPFGGGRIAPRIIAATLARLDAPLGRFAVLGNHDYTYGTDEIARALQDNGITVLSDEKRTLRHEGHDIDLVGLPDARDLRLEGRAILAGIERPTIVLAHDPFWFAHVPPGPHLTLAGHTHGGQVVLPRLGALTNASRAPRRWTYGHVIEDGRQLYVTSGIGTSGIPLRIGMPPEFAVIDVSAEH